MRRWLLGSAAILLAWCSSPCWGRDCSGPAARPRSAPIPAATAAPKIARSRIDKVTVYPNSALVTREVEVPAGTGLVELTVTPMPDRIVPSTMYSEAGDGLRVLTTRFTTRQVLEDIPASSYRLQARSGAWRKYPGHRGQDRFGDEPAACTKNMELLSKLETVTADRARRTGDEVIAVSKYVMEQRTEKSKEMVALKEQKRLNDIQVNFIQRKMGELGQGSGRMEREAVIVVDREKGGQRRQDSPQLSRQLRRLAPRIQGSRRQAHRGCAGRLSRQPDATFGRRLGPGEAHPVHRTADAQCLAARPVHVAADPGGARRSGRPADAGRRRLRVAVRQQPTPTPISPRRR